MRLPATGLLLQAWRGKKNFLTCIFSILIRRGGGGVYRFIDDFWVNLLKDAV
jgi:hypothetical protein